MRAEATTTSISTRRTARSRPRKPTTLLGGDGNDLVAGGTGAETIRGGAGDDVLWGFRGADDIFGDAGDDLINWRSGATLLAPSDGDDTIDGGAGTDTLDVVGSTLSEVYSLVANGHGVLFSRTVLAMSLDIRSTERLELDMEAGNDTFVPPPGLPTLNTYRGRRRGRERHDLRRQRRRCPARRGRRRHHRRRARERQHPGTRRQRRPVRRRRQRPPVRRRRRRHHHRQRRRRPYPLGPQQRLRRGQRAGRRRHAHHRRHDQRRHDPGDPGRRARQRAAGGHLHDPGSRHRRAPRDRHRRRRRRRRAAPEPGWPSAGRHGGPRLRQRYLPLDGDLTPCRSGRRPRGGRHRQLLGPASAGRPGAADDLGQRRSARHLHRD